MAAPVVFGAGGESGAPVNQILAAVGPRFALVPKVYPYAEGCCNPVLPQSLSIVAVGDIQSPMHLKQVVNQVNSSAQPAPFTAHIPQSTCLCFNDWTNGVLSDQQVMDAGGSPSFSIAHIQRCCRNPTLSVLDNNKVEVGHLVYNRPTCGMLCMRCICAHVCRTSSEPEWPWLSAVDGNEIERLTFRHAAREGQCLLCNWMTITTSAGCCTTLPDIPFHESTPLYGPFPQPGSIGQVDVRGAYGWDSFCGCGKTYGVRPELMATISLTQNLSFEDTTLAIEMALERTQAQLQYVLPHGQIRRLPFLKPGAVTMA